MPIATGTIDFLPRDCQLRGRNFRCYIRSNYILVSAAAVDRLGSLCAIGADEYATHVPLAFPGDDWPLSAWLGPELGEVLRVFLTEPDGKSWTRAERLSETSWPCLRMKALSIVNELLLSVRLIEAEVPLVLWRLAGAMSLLSPLGDFSRRLLWRYKIDPSFGGVLESSWQGG